MTDSKRESTASETAGPAVAAPPITGPALQIVTVDYDPRSLALTVAPSRVILKPGDVVIWQVVHRPEGFFPWVRFEPEEGPDGHPLGPLDALSQGGDGLWGVVQDRPGTYHYRAALKGRPGVEPRGELVAIYSRLIELEVQAEPVARSAATPPNLVQVKPGPLAHQLVVEPTYVSIHTGELVVWEFDPAIFPAGSEALIPRIEFTRYEGELEAGDLHYGPFTTFTYAAESAPAGTPARVTGTGSAGRPGLYRYQALAAKESTGEIVWASSDDPVVDDMGDPGGG